MNDATEARYRYRVDGRGNRTQIQELMPSSEPIFDAVPNNDERITYERGSWTTRGDSRVSASRDAKLSIDFFGKARTPKKLQLWIPGRYTRALSIRRANLGFSGAVGENQGLYKVF